jgi:predicted glycoside hydrolase/deacetylase ChbG (UPF0249 family)
LVGRDGRLALSWRQLLPRAAAGRIDPDDVEREMSAQLELLREALGDRPLSHVDTHQHLHLWPSIGKVVLGLAARHGIAAARITRSMGRSPIAAAVNRLARRFERRAHAAGIATPNAFAGFDEGGAMDAARFVAALGRLAATGARAVEMGVHPGEGHDPALARYEWGYAWGSELEALMSPDVRAAIDRHGFTLGTFAELGRVR